jgi:hypothetical protein
MSTETEQSHNPFEESDSWETPLEAILPVGNHAVTIAKASGYDTVDRGGGLLTASTGNPQLFLRFENEEGSIGQYETYHEGFLRKIVTVFDKAGVQRPQEGEFNPQDHCRLTDACIARLENHQLGIIVREETDNRDPLNPKIRKRVQGYATVAAVTGGPDARGLPVQAPSSSRPPEEASSTVPF